jgi:ankyrin repeat protein
MKQKQLILIAILGLALCCYSCSEQTNKYGNIFEAIRAGDIKAMKVIIKKEPNALKQIDEKSQYKGSALFEAIVLTAPINPSAQQFSKLLPKVDPKTSWEMIVYMIKKGADVNFKNEIGETPLQIAAAYGHKDLVVLLLDNNADINMQCTSGWSPLHQTAMKGKKDIAEYLIKKGANVNIKDKEGHTPLHSAAGYGYTDIVELLLINGAEVNIKDKDKHTPLDYALINLRYTTSEKIRSYGGKTTLSKKVIKKLDDDERKEIYRKQKKQ